MSGTRPPELDRLENAARAFEGLPALFAGEQALDEILGQMAVLAAAAIHDADDVSITVLESARPRTAAYTDERIVELDAAQYRSSRGPCLQAADSRSPVRAVMDADQHRWPEFVSIARDRGISATLSVPLIIDRADDEPELVGSLNIYSSTVSAFDPFDETVMQIFTLTAAQAVIQARRRSRARQTIDQLSEALKSRSAIDQAKGALRAIHGGSDDEAFRRLVRESQHTNVKIRDLARNLLDSL